MGRYAKPEWASFLDNKNVDTLSRKQLQEACKKARLNASASSDVLREQLKQFCNKSLPPPQWWVEEREVQRAKEAAKISLEFLMRCGEKQDTMVVTMKVGQYLEHISMNSKCKGGRMTLGVCNPAGCLTEKHRNTHGASYSRDAAIFTAIQPGTAKIAHETFSFQGYKPCCVTKINIVEDKQRQQAVKHAREAESTRSVKRVRRQ